MFINDLNHVPRQLIGVLKPTLDLVRLKTMVASALFFWRKENFPRKWLFEQRPLFQANGCKSVLLSKLHHLNG